MALEKDIPKLSLSHVRKSKPAADKVKYIETLLTDLPKHMHLLAHEMKLCLVSLNTQPWFLNIQHTPMSLVFMMSGTDFTS